MTRMILTSAFSLLASPILAATTPLECDAYFALNRYHVHATLDPATNHLTVTGEGGEVFRGFSVFSHSPRRGEDYYFLPYAFDNRGIEIRMDVDSGETWLCLQSNSCARCE